MEICKKDLCCGCFACLHTCPVNAINIEKDIEGFDYPNVNEHKCIKCQRCIKVCPANEKLVIGNKFEQRVYASWTKDTITRQQSTSGGMFTELAKFIIRQNGRVYGAAFDDEYNVHHIGIGNIEDIFKLQGSKYVQSYLGNVYKDILNDLEVGKYVLFSGTPCQVAGLRSYLEKDYDMLYTCDLVCHGVPTPSFFDAYKDYMIRRYRSNIVGINFRYKKPGWKEYSMKLDFANGRKYISSVFKDKYHRAFLDNFIERECCHGCKYSCSNRVGDITLADFWGYIANKPEYNDDDKGISQVIINTDKGLRLFDLLKSNIIYDEKTLEEAVNGNPCLSHSFPANPQRSAFWRGYELSGFKYVSEKYLKTVKYGKWWYLCIEKLKNLKTSFRIILSKMKQSMILNLLMPTVSLRRELYCRNIRKIYLRKANSCSVPTIITNNCVGGIIYHNLGMKFMSPTINLFIRKPEFIRYVTYLEAYSKTELTEISESGYNYPVGVLENVHGQVKIHFQHYDSFKEAKKKWIERTKRVDYQNLFVIMDATANVTQSDIIGFDKIPYKKIMLVCDNVKLDKYTYNIKIINNETGKILEYKSKYGIGRYLDQFDYASFLSNGKVPVK